MIIGLTGKNGAGKGVVADYFKNKGYHYFSLSDVIRDEIKKQGQEVTREALIAMGRKLRTDFGPSILADLILKKIPDNQNVIVDSVRNPGEVQSLRARKDFILLAIDADQKIRFERCKARGRESDPSDFATFVKLEEQELISANPAAQQLLQTVALADHTVMNDTTPEACFAQVENILNLEKAKR